MASGVWEYTIPRLQGPDPGQRAPPHPGQAGPQDLSGRVSALPGPLHCIYCRGEHSSSSYCSRPCRIAQMSRKKGRKKDSSSESDGDDGEVDDSSENDSSGDDSSEESSDSDGHEAEDDDVAGADALGPLADAGALENFYSAKKRVDSREITCVLHAKTLEFYFKRM